MLIGKNPQEVVEMLKKHVFGKKIRHPHAITTCNGIQLIYLLDGGEFKSKEQFQEIIKLRAAIVSKLVEIFSDFGVDTGAFLPTQIFRAAGSQHRKTGVIAQTSYYFHEIPHIRTFADEIDADPEEVSTISNDGSREKKKLPAKHRKAIFNAKQEIRQAVINELSGFVMNHMGILVPIRGNRFDGTGEYDFWTRCDAILADLIRLATIRKDNPSGTRRRARIAFVASVLAHLRFNSQEAREFVYGVSYVFTEPKDEDILEQKVQEGKEYSELLSKVMRIPNTKTIITKWLQGITDQESSQLITLTTPNENLRRERIAKKIKRGSGTAERYRELRAKQKQDNQLMAAQMRENGMSVKQISETMGVSECTVKRWFRETR
jgi:predicted transcriptional regulator